MNDTKNTTQTQNESQEIPAISSEGDTLAKSKTGKSSINKNEAILAEGSFPQLLIKLCIPSVVIILVMIIYNMADTYFIGQTGDPNKIAAIPSPCRFSPFCPAWRPCSATAAAPPSPWHSDARTIQKSNPSAASAAIVHWRSASHLC